MSVRLPLMFLLSLFLASGYVLPTAAEGAVACVVSPSIGVGIAGDGVTDLAAADTRLLSAPGLLAVVGDSEHQSGSQIGRIPTATRTGLQASSAPSPTPVDSSAYPIDAPPPAPPADTPALPTDYPDPTDDSLQPLPDATPVETMWSPYPDPVETAPTATPAITDTETPVATSSATPTASPTLTATTEPTIAAPTASEPPPAESAPSQPTPQPGPLIPRGLFFLLVAGLFAFTGALFVYLWRGRKGAGE